MKKRINLLTGTILLSVMCAVPTLAQDYDLVINNGRVMDPETLFDDIANVGNKDGRIVAISKDALEGTETVDATGHIVAPGFIDTHFHWQAPLGYAIGLRDGLTSAMDLELACPGTFIARWYEARAGVTQANYGCASSHEQSRQMVIDGKMSDEIYMRGPMAVMEARKKSGWSLDRATLEQGNEILEIIDKGLQDGAIGIGSTLGYMRDGVTTREMFEVQKVAARYDRLTGGHTRFTPDNDVMENLGQQELLLNAVALDAPAIALHFNNPGWQLTTELLSRLQEAGHNVWGEVYPYTGGTTFLNAVFLAPDNWVERMGHRYEDTLQDPITGDFYDLDRYNADMETDPTKLIVLYKMPNEDVPKWLTLKGVTVASDSVVAEPIFGPWDFPLDQLGPTHPRTSGTRSLSLRLGRENNIPMMQLLSILSYNAAKHLGDTGLKAMQERGRMQTGMVADIVVFDPELVTDNSTYANGAVPSTGFKAVIVRGQVTVRDDELLGVFAGQPIRFEPEDKPRFEPISEEAWNAEFSTGMPEVAPAFPVNGGN